MIYEQYIRCQNLDCKYNSNDTNPEFIGYCKLEYITINKDLRCEEYDTNS